MSPGPILLVASQAFSAKSYRADEYFRMILDILSLDVSQCTSAVGSLSQAAEADESCKVWGYFPL